MKYLLPLALLIGCAAPSKEESDSVEKKYRIAYNVLLDAENDDYEVFTMGMDGGDRKNVTNKSGVEWTYRSAGKDLLYISDQDTCHRCYFLYSCDANGQNHRRIGGYQLKDSWMDTRNDGSEIIVNPKVEGDSAFYIIRRSGELVRKVYTGLAYFSDPAFSPDGNQIVFRGSEKRFKRDIGYQDELYIVNVNGTGLRQLTNYPAKDTTANWYSYHAGPPFWDPNNNIITYHSVQQGGSFLFQINPDGTGQKRLTPDSLKVGWHSWSSDGKWIVFDVDNTVGDQYNWDLYLMEYPEGSITRLTSDPGYEQSPVFVEIE